MVKQRGGLRPEILKLVRRYVHEELLKRDRENQQGISYGGRIYDDKEVVNLVDSALDFWLTAGAWAESFERRFAKYLGVRYCSLTNSGSSANLLAFMALTSHKLGERRIVPGDEVITVAAGFPTTVAPILQASAVPVFIDIEIPSYNIDCAFLDTALSGKTKAVFVAHTLGNPVDLQSIKDFCEANNLWLIEDNCDALGAQSLVDGTMKYTGTIGHLATSSFYASHHITMGEGGAVYTNDRELKILVESFRDWGRDCICAPGQDNCCGKRFAQQLGDLPYGYDHKYTFSHFGYNLKITDMQAAIGCAQLDKLESFVTRRRENWQALKEKLGKVEDYLVLPVEQPGTMASWFGFVITVRNDAPFSRDELVSHLEKNMIQTRMLFAGNLLRHPCFDEYRASGQGFRVIGELPNTERVMNDSFWIGVYPGIDDRQLDKMATAILQFCEK